MRIEDGNLSVRIGIEGYQQRLAIRGWRHLVNKLSSAGHRGLLPGHRVESTQCAIAVDARNHNQRTVPCQSKHSNISYAELGLAAIQHCRIVHRVPDSEAAKSVHTRNAALSTE